MKVIRIAVIASVLSFASAAAFAKEPPKFKDIDADGDGTLNAEEFAKAREGGVELTFEEVDLNKDGKIDAEEYEEAVAGCA